MSTLNRQLGLAMSFVHGLCQLTVTLVREVSRRLRRNAANANHAAARAARISAGTHSRTERIASRDAVPEPQYLLSPAELLHQLIRVNQHGFEQLVARTCSQLGYDVAFPGVLQPNRGIDLVIQKCDEVSAVQCCLSEHPERSPEEVRTFSQAMADAHLSEGIIITLGGFSEAAREAAVLYHVELIDRSRLLMILESVNARMDPEFLAILTANTHTERHGSDFTSSSVVPKPVDEAAGLLKRRQAYEETARA